MGGGGGGVGVYGFGPPRLWVGDMAKISLFFFFKYVSRFYRFFIMFVFLFCKLFEHYSQTNFPIIKSSF